MLWRSTGTGTSFIKNFSRIIVGMLEEREESEKGGALFTRDYGRMSSYYSNRTFLPEFKRNINEIIPDNR